MSSRKKIIRHRPNWERIRKFFEDPVNKEVLSISGVERVSDIAQNALRHALKGRRNFPEEYEEKTTQTLERFGMPPSDEN